MRVARDAGLSLRIAAKVDPVDRTYFESEIRPLLESMPNVEFLGEIGDRAKAELLGGATALLFPIDWPEPFGLVMIEALACGTPVIARRRGSVPEVLRDGVTGFLCETETEMVHSVALLPEISRRRCRGGIRHEIHRSSHGEALPRRVSAIACPPRSRKCGHRQSLQC